MADRRRQRCPASRPTWFATAARGPSSKPRLGGETPNSRLAADGVRRFALSIYSPVKETKGRLLCRQREVQVVTQTMASVRSVPWRPAQTVRDERQGYASSPGLRSTRRVDFKGLCRNVRTCSPGITPCSAFGTTQSCARGIVLNISTACSGVTMSRSPMMMERGCLDASQLVVCEASARHGPHGFQLRENDRPVVCAVGRELRVLVRNGLASDRSA